MKFPAIFAPFVSKVFGNLQSARIEGNNNSINQVFISVKAEELGREIVREALADQTFIGRSINEIEEKSESDSPEVKRILEYREIANKGDSSTALDLLSKLKAEDGFGDGHRAFRLHLNVGLIQQNIGELDMATASFKAANAACPEDLTAQAALALADYNQGRVQEAFERAEKLLATAGKHQNLATLVFLYAAGSLRRDVKLEELGLKEPYSADIFAAYLEYLRRQRPAEFVAAIEDAFGKDPDNQAIASLWALTVLEDANQNQAFVLGARMPELYEEKVAKSAAILKAELEAALEWRPPNKLLLPSQANNAAVGLRLAGKAADAAKLLDRTLHSHPPLQEELAQIRAALFLQEDRDDEAFNLVKGFKTRPELQLMAAEIEAKLGRGGDAINRINDALGLPLTGSVKARALFTKARIAIWSRDRDAADQALDELSADFDGSPELVITKSAYSRAFELKKEEEQVQQRIEADHEATESDRKLLASVASADEWDFLTVLQTADELLARGYFRQSAALLRGKVSFAKESPALETLADACVRGGLVALAKEVSEGLAPSVRNSVFGWKFDANVSYLSGEIAKAVPLTRKLFERNPKSLSALDWYVQSLLRMNDKARLCRAVNSLSDREMVGTLREKQEYVKLLVFCDELARARSYAYQLFCENRNDHRAWMAITASVLTGQPTRPRDELDLDAVQEDAAFEVMRGSGDKRTWIIEGDNRLLQLRDENIPPDHPVAQAAWGKREGEEFEWPLGKPGERVKIASVKHKALDAFHFVLKRFEEQFPDISGFKSVPIDATKEDGLEEIKTLLQQRAEYAQQMAKEYQDGSYPLSMLGFHLGIDAVDAFLGLKRECGVALKVSSCTNLDQEKASRAIKSARIAGIVADAVSCHLIRRLQLEQAIEQEFGRIGVTQTTLDLFAHRLQEAERLSFFEGEDGNNKTSSLSFYDGQIIVTETSEEEAKQRVGLIAGDLDWLQNNCELVATVPKTDPDDAIIRFRNQEGGRFFDDIFAADGSGRLLLSDDYHVRQWAEGIFGVPTAWLQALLFHLEEVGRVNTETVVQGTIQLLAIGEDALSLNPDRLYRAAEMMEAGSLSAADFEILCSIIGQSGADVPSHVFVAVAGIARIWSKVKTRQIKEGATSVILRNLVRNQGEKSRAVLDDVQRMLRDGSILNYIEGWRVGHFLV